FATLHHPNVHKTVHRYCISFQDYGDHRDLHSFPTRRSSDLSRPRHSVRRSLAATARAMRTELTWWSPGAAGSRGRLRRARLSAGDRKSTRLNSSHVAISYAVFCLKKKITDYCATTADASALL